MLFSMYAFLDGVSPNPLWISVFMRAPGRLSVPMRRWRSMILISGGGGSVVWGDGVSSPLLAVMILSSFVRWILYRMEGRLVSSFEVSIDLTVPAYVVLSVWGLLYRTVSSSERSLVVV